MKNGTTPKGAPVQPAKENVAGTGTKENIEKRPDGRKSNRGGRRTGSGRKPKMERLEAMNATQLVDIHINEEVEVTITDRKTGTVAIVSKPRILAALEKLFTIGTSGKGEANAIDKWLDRAMGRPAQALAVKHSGEIGTYTAKKPSKAALAAKKAYAANLED